jgi:hypothetical protein
MPIIFDKLMKEMKEVYDRYDGPAGASSFIDGEIYALYRIGYISLKEYNIATAKNIDLHDSYKYDNDDD